jgi:hypothetical protein
MRFMIDEWLRSPFGGVVLHRWFDFTVLRLLTGFVLPCQRLAALGESVDFDLRRFRDSGVKLPFWVSDQRLAPLLDALRSAYAEMMETEAHARKLIGAAVSQAQYAAAERERVRASSAYLVARYRFGDMIMGANAVAFRTASEDEVAAEFGGFLDQPARMFMPPEQPVDIAESPEIPIGGSLTRALRFSVPGSAIEGPAFARVFEPVGAAAAPTFIYAHGIAIDGDQLGLGIDEIASLTGRGVRVVRLVNPWHGRRRLRGSWSGEPVLAEAPLGAFRFMTTIVRELAVLVRWVRQRYGGAVAIGGLSLGALSAQLATVHCKNWPEEMRPDAALLMTTDGRLDRVAFEGLLTQKVGLDRALADAGWSREKLARWQPLVNAEQPLSLDPARVVIALGGADEVTRFKGGLALARLWDLPERNLFVRSRQGHFSVPLGMVPDDAPLARLTDILYGRD